MSRLLPTMAEGLVALFSNVADPHDELSLGLLCYADSAPCSVDLFPCSVV